MCLFRLASGDSLARSSDVPFHVQVEVGAVELAQERVRLAERRGSAKHAGTSNAMVVSGDVASSPLQVDAAQPEVALSEAMPQQRPAASDWTQPHALERRPKVQRRLQQAANLRQDLLPSAAHAMPHRQTSSDVALQRHRSGAPGTLDSYPALAALASFLDKGRLVLWELNFACIPHIGRCCSWRQSHCCLVCIHSALEHVRAEGLPKARYLFSNAGGAHHFAVLFAPSLP